MSETIYIPGDRLTVNLSSNEAGWNLEVEKAGIVSDGYHTFDELYKHRYLLFCLASSAFWRNNRLYCWKSKTHWIDGNLEPCWDGWFVAGIDLSSYAGSKNEGGMITYHLPLSYWEIFQGIEREQAPPHDGHDSKDVIERIKAYLEL